MEARQSLHERKRDDFSSTDKTELMHSPPIDETEDALRMRLWRIRDFLYLILSYPMKIGSEDVLGRWVMDANSTRILTNRKFSPPTDSLYTPESDIFTSGYGIKRLLSQGPLKHLEGLIPNDIIREIENGRRFLFKDHETATSQGKSEQQPLTSSTSSTREGKQVLQLNEVDAVIPQSILNLATDLAVDQLIHYLPIFGRMLGYIRLSTRSEDEKLAIKRKIEAALKEVIEWNGKGATKVIWIDASKYEVDKEVAVTREIAEQLEFIATETMLPKDFRVIVVVVDGNDENKLRLGHVHFPYTEMGYETALVLLTTESATDENEESRMELDLEIRTDYHLLPWLLFSRNVGSEVLCSSSAIENIAEQIVEECRGHLLAIVLVAKSLKNVTDVEHWKHALEKLCGTTSNFCDKLNIHDDRIMVNAFRNIIWEDLNSVEKQCLKHYSFLLKTGDEVPDTFLISKWVDRGLVNTREEAEKILQLLLDRSILLKQKGMDFQLPMEIRSILLSLSGLDSIVDMCSLRELNLTDCKIWEELPREIEDLVNLQKVVIVRTPVTNLPQFPDWPDLRELHLQENAGLTEIPRLFFEKLCKLRFLDLSYTNISELPSSFFYLEGLGELYMRGCELFMKLPPEIKLLKTLWKLDLNQTQITHLPSEIQELTNLLSLTLCFYGYDQSTDPIIPTGVISKLTNLSDLSIDINPDDNRWDKNIQAILPEFSELRGLTTLTLYIPRVELLKHLLNRKYIDFRYTVGNHKKRLISREPLAVTAKFKESRYKLRFVNGVDVPKEINTILSRTKALFLDRHMSIKSLSEFEVEDVVKLSTCIVGECNEMEMLVDGNSPNKSLLLHAEFLSVYYMKNLKSILRGPVPSVSCFRRLKHIALQTCPKLTTIFTLDFLDNLSMLEELLVEDCSRVTTLISRESSNVVQKRFLPKLKRLLLVYLPELVSISSGLLIGERIEKMGFYYCPKLGSLSQEELSSQELKIIKGETKWWEELNWNQWGQAGRPNKFNDLFSPIDEEDDVMSQLIEE